MKFSKLEVTVLQAGITMFAVGITDKVDYNELVTIASSPSDDYIFRTEELDQVSYLTSRLVWNVCNEAFPCSTATDNCTSGTEKREFPALLSIPCGYTSDPIVKLVVVKSLCRRVFISRTITNVNLIS